MTKKIFTLVAVATTVISLTGCFSKTNTLTTESNVTLTGNNTTGTAVLSNQPYEYKNKDKGFSFTLPAKWTFQENVFGSLVMFFTPQETGDTIKENVGVTTTELTGDISLTGFYELTKGNIESVINGFTLVKEEATTIDGENAMKIIYQGTEDTKPLEREQVVLLKGTTAYMFTYTATEKTFNNFLDEVDNIINSFSM